MLDPSRRDLPKRRQPLTQHYSRLYLYWNLMYCTADVTDQKNVDKDGRIVFDVGTADSLHSPVCAGHRVGAILDLWALGGKIRIEWISEGC
jgi:hypothetical protein